MKKIGIFGIASAITLAVACYFFIQLGGNNPIEITLIEGNPETLAGKTFKGIPQDKKLEETFKAIETQQSLNPGSKIHTIYYIEPAGKLDTMEVFVGLNLPFASGELEPKSFQESRYLVAKVSANKWVMPGPNKVKAKLEEFAQENKVKLSGIFIDKIISETEVHVIAPIK
ncbi:hypothetical protein [Algoriphagus sp. AK58]|uniref:hypothetical protein n=1 Tax=Algoriphagus sp. AK58 TaxID=1406877 RepID=UPI0016508DD9|nr:hypothetical protein [Algoriphagus sp. AK58]MBC6368447.1 hypothetical protein [Algoriphagus sp. AK58]